MLGKGILPSAGLWEPAQVSTLEQHMFHRARGPRFATDSNSQYLLSRGTSFLVSAAPDVILGLKSAFFGPGEPGVSRQQRCWFISPAFLREFREAAGPKARAGLCSSARLVSSRQESWALPTRARALPGPSEPG